MSLDDDTTTVGVLLAGGTSRRMGGGDKCLALLGARALLAHAIDRLSPQVDTMLLSANGDPARFAAFGLQVVADPAAFAGPLAGILSAMTWARDHCPDARRIVSAPTDTPFFPGDLVARLTAAATGASGVAIARSCGRDHRVFGIFPVACADNLERFLAAAASPRVGDWLAEVGFGTADFDLPPSGPDPFFNVNTPDDLRLAEAMLASASGLRPNQI